MSSSNADSETPPPRESGAVDPTGRRVGRATATLHAVAFWAAVVLPFVSLLLLLGGVDTAVEFAVLVALVTANVVALYFGHDYPSTVVADGDDSSRTEAAERSTRRE